MRKTIFKSESFYIILIISIGLLLCYNTYAFLITSNWISLIPIVIQMTLLFFILMKHEYAKIGIKIWAAILILAHSLKILAMLIKLMIGEFDDNQLSLRVYSLVLLIAGILIYNYNESTVEVKEIDKTPKN